MRLITTVKEVSSYHSNYHISFINRQGNRIHHSVLRCYYYSGLRRSNSWKIEIYDQVVKGSKQRKF